MPSVEHPKPTERTVFIGYRGSQAHGTYTPSSGFDDVDYMQVEMPTLQDCFGAFGKPWRGRDFKEGALDLVTYEFRHFTSLLAKGNPNVVGMLWLEAKHIQHMKWPFEIWRAHRDIFLSQRLGASFSGYAYSQFKRMTAFQKYEGYMGEKRKSLVDKFGYDVKNAAHLIRLLRMGTEALDGKGLIVERPDAEELIRIKLGKVSFPDLQALAEVEWKRFEAAQASTSLPKEPNYEVIDGITTTILRDWFKRELMELA